MVPLRKIVFASYASQTYTAIIGIALIPLYLSYLGAEAFGLVGFYDNPGLVWPA